MTLPKEFVDFSEFGESQSLSVMVDCGGGNTSPAIEIITILEVEIVYSKCFLNSIQPDVWYQLYHPHNEYLDDHLYKGSCICDFVEEVAQSQYPLCYIRETDLTTNELVYRHFGIEGCFERHCQGLDGIDIDGKEENKKTAFWDTEGSMELIQAFPNPARNNLNLRWNNPRNESIQIEIYSLEGSLVWKKELNSDGCQINTQNWVEGMYYAKISSSRENSTITKIMVSR